MAAIQDDEPDRHVTPGRPARESDLNSWPRRSPTNRRAPHASRKRLRRRWVPARVALETSDVNLLGDLVARGLGVTIVPRSIAEAAAARHPLHIVGIRPAITRRYTVLVWNEDRARSTAAEAFLTHARAWAVAGAP
jgi:DNA-binding transcriptional LysR family regulator